MTDPASTPTAMQSYSQEKDLEKAANETAPTESPNQRHVEEESQEHGQTGTAKSQESTDRVLVKFEDGDPDNPLNFSPTRKWFITAQLGFLALSASLGASITTPAAEEIAAYIGVGSEVIILNVSLYILGFVVGPLIWAPVSEIWGRRMSMLPAMAGLTLFSIGFGLSKNATSVFVCRFFSGVFGSAPVSNVSAALGDIYIPRERGVAVVFYAIAVTGGPTLGPVVGSGITVNLGWRWTGYVLAIWSAATTAFLYFFCPEVYAPYLLQQKAKRLRKETGDARYFHPHEDIEVDMKSIVTKHFTRPVSMLVTEPMVAAIALYASFVFALLFMTLEVFPIVYREIRGWSFVVSTLPFVALFIGINAAAIVNFANQSLYARAVDANDGKPVPEARLPPIVLGSIIFPIGLFLFGWTSERGVSWIPSVFAAGFIGAGFNIIFQQCINFLVDTYRVYAASAVSANVFLRSIMAAGLPLAARPMFMNLGPGKACSILGGIAVAAIPVPFIFMKYGKRLRGMSRYAAADDG